jgi:hypothetical protein
MRPLLSILTPAVPSRLEQLGKLCAFLHEQIGELPVEHLVFLDNKRRTVGEKRDALLRAARGDYVAFLDDDDGVAGNYVRAIISATRTGPDRPDVITFLQESTVEGLKSTIEFRLGNPNEPFKPGDMTKRNAWHVCAWRRELAILSHFPPINYGEDWAYAARLCAIAGLTEAHIPRVLHFYNHSRKTTEAPVPA